MAGRNNRKLKVVVAARRADDVMGTRGEPPLGSLQAKILKQIQRLKKEAFAYKVLGELTRESQAFIDPAAIYTNLRKMSERGYVEQVDIRYDTRGPAQKIYGVTPAGEEALKRTKAYHAALAAYL